MLKKYMEFYRYLILIPVIITIIALAFVAVNGLDEGIDLKGGSIATIGLNEPMTQAQLESNLKTNLQTDDLDILNSRDKQATVEFSTELDAQTLEKKLNNTGSIISLRSVGPSLSQEALGQIYWAILFAFIAMAIVVFIIFREFVPSAAVVLSCFCDIVIAIGLMSLFNVPLSIASVGAILMLIGFSVDTDILLTTRLLKRKIGTLEERAIEAIKTGLVMSAASISAMIILYLITVFIMPEAQTLSDIALVLIFGLLADIICTWCMNLGLLRWYVEAKK